MKILQPLGALSVALVLGACSLQSPFTWRHTSAPNVASSSYPPQPFPPGLDYELIELKLPRCGADLQTCSLPATTERMTTGLPQPVLLPPALLERFR